MDLKADGAAARFLTKHGLPPQWGTLPHVSVITLMAVEVFERVDKMRADLDQLVESKEKESRLLMQLIQTAAAGRSQHARTFEKAHSILTLQNEIAAGLSTRIEVLERECRKAGASLRGLTEGLGMTYRRLYAI